MRLSVSDPLQVTPFDREQGLDDFLLLVAAGTGGRESFQAELDRLVTEMLALPVAGAGIRVAGLLWAATELAHASAIAVGADLAEIARAANDDDEEGVEVAAEQAAGVDVLGILTTLEGGLRRVWRQR